VELIGMLDSPFVRRVAVTARFLEIPYEHNPLSIFKGYDEFRGVNPLVKVPTLVCIIDYLE
jgi:glutathione S-transferase